MKRKDDLNLPDIQLAFDQLSPGSLYLEQTDAPVCLALRNNSEVFQSLFLSFPASLAIMISNNFK
jgi:hypothetical protein